MEFRELEYERLKQERAIRGRISMIDVDLAAYKKAKKIEKGALYRKLAELEKELESGAMQPGLFEQKAEDGGQTAVYPEGEEKLSVISDRGAVNQEGKITGEPPVLPSEENAGPARKVRGKIQRTDDGGQTAAKKSGKDTMKVERTLLTVFQVCDVVRDGKKTGCCQCEEDDCLECEDRIIEFGNAINCISTAGCSSECPRLIQKKDIDNARDAKAASEEELFRKAKEWYENTPEHEIINGGKFGLRTIVKLQKTLNLTYSQAANFFDRIIDKKSKSEEEKTTDKNVCATQIKDWELANIAKVPKGFTVYRLDLENKTILEFSFDKKEFSVPVEYKTKKACLNQFRELTSMKTCLDICRAGEWPKKIAAWTGETLKTQFRGDFKGSPYDKKQIRFIHSGMAGWGKPRKFTNLEQYEEDMARFRKDPDYIEA